MNEWSFFANGGNQSWQVWVVLEVKTKMAESKMAKTKISECKMATIIKLIEKNEFESDWISLSQSGVRVFLSESEEDNKVSESKMAVSESNMTEFKIAIINLSQNDGCHHQVWVSLKGKTDGWIQDG